MNYSDYIEKIAAGGLIGFNLGAVGGLIGGATLGSGAAKIIHRQTPEHKKIRETYNNILNENHQLDLDLLAEKDKIDSYPDKLYSKLNTPEMDQKTVREVEAYADKIFKDYKKNQPINKTASFKTGLMLGTGLGALVGAPIGYKSEKRDRTDTSWLKESIESQKKLGAKTRKEIENLKVGNNQYRTALQNTDYADGYSPYLMSRNHNSTANKLENDYSYGQVIDEYLKRKKQDASSMKWGDYKKLVDSHIENINDGIMPWEE